MRILCLTTLATVVCSTAQLVAGGDTYVRPELLMEPADLAGPGVAAEFVILDVRSEEAYEKEHLPGALRVNHDAWKGAFGDGQDAKAWGERIGRLGIGPDTKVVVYDERVKDAGRVWWILRYWGVADARLLNGGWKTWKSLGCPTSDRPPFPFQPVRFAATPATERLMTMGQVLESLRGNRLPMIDTRSPDEFCGIEKKKNNRGGAMPGAKHLDWTNLIDPETQRFKKANELRRLFDNADIDLEGPLACHCQSGARASVMVFALELMGAKNVRHYYPGWSEWGNADDTPIIVPQKSKKE